MISTTQSYCPPGESLRRLLDDRLNGAESGLLEEHVERCTHCQHLLELMTTDAALRPSERPRPRFSPEGDFLNKLRAVSHADTVRIETSALPTVAATNSCANSAAEAWRSFILPGTKA